MVPGFPTTAPPNASDSLADRSFQLTWRISEGPGIFDRNKDWDLKLITNRDLPTDTTTTGFTGTLGSISVESSTTSTPAEKGGVNFQTALTDKFFVVTLHTTSEKQQSFFASGGTIDLTGHVKDQGEGTSTILYNNFYWPTTGPPNENFPWLGKVLQTAVFDKFTSAPEPSTVLLFGTGILALLGSAWRRRPR